MKQYGLLVICLVMLSLLLSGCNTASKSTIKYERKLGKYFETESQNRAEKVIDLSEGPKLKYNANFGPKDLNFDIKIINPY